MINIITEDSTSRFSKRQNSFHIKYLDTGCHIAEENWAHKKRFLDTYEMIFVTRGTLFLQVNETPYALTEGHILILPPYSTLSSFEKSELATSFYWVRFEADNLHAFNILDGRIKVQNPYEYLKLFKELASVSDTAAATFPAFTPDLVVALLLSNLSADCRSGTRSRRVDVAGIAEWIDSNVNAEMTVEQVSKTFSYHRDYLCRVFKAETGTTLRDYIIMKQLKKAGNLLLTSDYSIKRIAQILKYESTNLFVKFFKYHEKESPTAYRKTRSCYSNRSML